MVHDCVGKHLRDLVVWPNHRESAPAHEDASAIGALANRESQVLDPWEPRHSKPSKQHMKHDTKCVELSQRQVEVMGRKPSEKLLFVHPGHSRQAAVEDRVFSVLGFRVKRHAQEAIRRDRVP
jgi:hypothetical protein